jgi:hypothetical protein
MHGDWGERAQACLYGRSPGITCNFWQRYSPAFGGISDRANLALQIEKKPVFAKRLRGRPHHEKDRYRCRDRNLVRTVGHAC